MNVTLTHPHAPFGASSEALGRNLRDAFHQRLQQQPRAVTTSDAARTDAAFRALAALCKDTLLQRWGKTQIDDADQVGRGKVRRVHYLSMEFLLGRTLGNAMAALFASFKRVDAMAAGVQDGGDELRRVLADYGLELSQVLESELDAALGNGGLGRLAACFLDAFAELGMPAFGYGLRYQYGMFAQRIEDKRQVEVPDDWMRLGNAWEVERPELRYAVGFGGAMVEKNGVSKWQPEAWVQAEAFDFIVPAHHSERVVTLRQWHARALQPIDFQAFCRGDYLKAGEQKTLADALNWVLYPDDSTDNGRELRLKQELLLVSASVQDMIARHLRQGGRIEQFGQRNAIHLNDTHPALAPIELMRLLIDEHHLGFDAAWKITQQACSYTNHTLMPEALETWPVALFERLLPRHLQLIYQINHRFLQAVRQRVDSDESLISRVSLVDEQNGRRVRMANIAIIGSHKTNGVAALHSKLMQETIFADYAKLFPERFHNVTNGVTPRRWLMQANPLLSELIDSRIGKHWRRDLSQLAQLLPHCTDPELGRGFMAVKRVAKHKLARHIERDLGIVVDPSSMFDVQIKRIHEYKRQLLNLLQIIARYQAIISQAEDADSTGFVPRTVIISGKAASAYHTAKLIIQLAHDMAEIINNDPRVGGRLKLVFMPNYSVSLAELIIPAADLSEQISTAGTEASGTGNMKFGMNGACTLGTWDGANIEMAEAIGKDYFFEFGLRAEAIAELAKSGYVPNQFAQNNPTLERVLSALERGDFSANEPGRYWGLAQQIRHQDRYFLCADFADYLRAQAEVDALFEKPGAWAECALRNIAGMGQFSVDRTVQEYLDRVWAPNAAQNMRNSFAVDSIRE